MEVFLERKHTQLNNDIPQYLLDEIEAYAHTKPLEESCGLICSGEESMFFLPCENLSKNKTRHFAINPLILIENNVNYIYHSHVSQSSKPSILDIKSSNALCISYLIYSLRDKDFYLYKCV